MMTESQFSADDVKWMQHALQLAKVAQQQQEVPVGAVLVSGNEFIAEGWNCPIGTLDATAHAEIMALREGAKKIKNYRLVNTTLYVTLEPCLMCVGALVHARVSRVVFGAFEPKTGAVDSAFQLRDALQLNHRIEYQGGLLAGECSEMLKNFFRERRQV